MDIWERIDEAFEEDTCMERFYFNEPLTGNCIDSYRKLMEFRKNCLELFEYTFGSNSTWKSEDVSGKCKIFLLYLYLYGNNFKFCSLQSQYSKKIGQSATEFCDALDSDNVEAKEFSDEEDVTLLTQYMKKLSCIFENFHYLDAYGRVDVSTSDILFKISNPDIGTI